MSGRTLNLFLGLAAVAAAGYIIVFRGELFGGVSAGAASNPWLTGNRPNDTLARALAAGDYYA